MLFRALFFLGCRLYLGLLAIIIMRNRLVGAFEFILFVFLGIQRNGFFYCPNNSQLLRILSLIVKLFIFLDSLFVEKLQGIQKDSGWRSIRYELDITCAILNEYFGDDARIRFKAITWCKDDISLWKGLVVHVTEWLPELSPADKPTRI